jgi:hypothetical protein
MSRLTGSRDQSRAREQAAGLFIIVFSLLPTARSLTVAVLSGVPALRMHLMNNPGQWLGMRAGLAPPARLPPSISGAGPRSE